MLGGQEEGGERGGFRLWGEHEQSKRHLCSGGLVGGSDKLLQQHCENVKVKKVLRQG